MVVKRARITTELRDLLMLIAIMEKIFTNGRKNLCSEIPPQAKILVLTQVSLDNSIMSGNKTKGKVKFNSTLWVYFLCCSFASVERSLTVLISLIDLRGRRGGIYEIIVTSNAQTE